MFRHTQRRQHGGSVIGVLLLLAQVLHIGTDHIPAVTLSVVGLNAAIYMGFLRAFLPFLPHLNKACSSYKLVFSNKEYYRLITSSFYHLDDMHLYFNMVSFIWKGISLERRYGARKFMIMIILFSLLSQLGMLTINKGLSVVLLNDSYLYTCAAGFSAVIFALKVITTHHLDQNELIMGMFSVPSRYACWAELIIIQILVPNASFTGHLAGILTGILFVKGPLKKIVKVIDKLIQGKYSRGSSQGFRAQAGRSGEASGHYGQQNDADEGLQEAIRESLRYRDAGQRNSQQPPPYGWSVSGDHHDQRSDGLPYPPESPMPRANVFSRENQSFSSTGSYSRTEPSAPTLADDDHRGSHAYTTSNPSWGTAPPPYSSLPPDARDSSFQEYPPPRYSESQETANAENIRRARLRRFQKT